MAPLFLKPLGGGGGGGGGGAIAPPAPPGHTATAYGTCPRCGKSDHKAAKCPFQDVVCYFCNKTGHLEAVCLKKKKSEQQSVNTIKHRIQTVIEAKAVPQLKQVVKMNSKIFTFEVDTGAGDNFCEEATWKDLGRPTLSPATSQYEVANGQPLPTLGRFTASVALHDNEGSSIPLNFTVAKVPRLNLLGRDAVVKLGINVSALMGVHTEAQQKDSVTPIHLSKADTVLQEACKKLCLEFPDLFKSEMGCLKDYQLEVKFKPNTKPVFCKPPVVPFSIQENLCKAFDAGIAKGVWQPTQFNEYGTPVVPIRKATLPGQSSPKLRVCGDYSVTVNSQLEPHRYPCHVQTT